MAIQIHTIKFGECYEIYICSIENKLYSHQNSNCITPGHDSKNPKAKKHSGNEKIRIKTLHYASPLERTAAPINAPSNNNDIISNVKSARANLLKTNSELQEKTVGSTSSTEQTTKQSALIQEINNSKKELSEIKEQNNGYKNEL